VLLHDLDELHSMHPRKSMFFQLHGTG
jgi:hypothetical protein